MPALGLAFFCSENANDFYPCSNASTMITVVIASYQYGHLAAHCIESLLSQTVAPSRIIFADDGADNWLRSDAIELLSQASSDIVTYDIVVTGELKEEIHDRVPGETIPYQGDLYWDREGKHHGSMMYRTELAQKIGYKRRYADGVHAQEDWNLWEKMLEQGASVSSLKEGLLYYRRHRENFLKYDHLIEEVEEAS